MILGGLQAEIARMIAAYDYPETPTTPYFPADVLPLRTGVYEVEPIAAGVRSFRYFDGWHWYTGGNNPDLALHMFQTLGVRVRAEGLRAWRGLTERAP